MHFPKGKHLIIELFGIEKFKINYKKFLTEMAVATKCNPLKYMEHDFKPQGKSAIIILEESHISIHTYPEFAYAAMDIFTCGDQSKPYEDMEVLKKYLNPKYIELNEIQRGIT